MVVVIAHRLAGLAGHPALVRAKLAEHRVERAGLVGVIGPDDGDPFAGIDREGGNSKPPPWPSPARGGGVRKCQAVALKDQVAGARGTQADPDLLIVRGRRDPVEAVELGLPAACLAGALSGFI